MTVETICVGPEIFNTDTVLEVGKFTILWNIFENKKCSCYCSPSKIMKMEEVLVSLNNDPFEKLASELFKRADKLGYGNVVSYVKSSLYSSNAIITNVDQKTHIPEIIKFIESGGENKLGALFAIYRIRNNMFHGLKGYSELDNQISLFSSMNAVLEEIL